MSQSISFFPCVSLERFPLASIERSSIWKVSQYVIAGGCLGIGLFSLLSYMRLLPGGWVRFESNWLISGVTLTLGVIFSLKIVFNSYRIFLINGKKLDLPVFERFKKWPCSSDPQNSNSNFKLNTTTTWRFGTRAKPCSIAQMSQVIESIDSNKMLKQAQKGDFLLLSFCLSPKDYKDVLVVFQKRDNSLVVTKDRCIKRSILTEFDSGRIDYP